LKRRTNYFFFDLPLRASCRSTTRKRRKSLFELTNETREMKVNQPVQFVPVTELSDNGIIKYSLEEYGSGE
jgi:cell division protein FtsZ